MGYCALKVAKVNSWRLKFSSENFGKLNSYCSAYHYRAHGELK